MKVAIIGAGFAGLSAAYRLAKKDMDVTVFELEDKPGGLAVGFREPGWKWSLEKHYHHWFFSDWTVRNLAKEVGHEVIIVPTKASTFIDGKTYQLDSPISLLRFEKLSLIERLRVGTVLAYLKISPFWKSLEGITAKEFLVRFMGKNSWRILWEPLFEKKFSIYADKIPASWFWARIKKRSPTLAYPKGGFLSFAETLEHKAKESKAKFYYGTSIESVEKQKGKFIVKTEKDNYSFDVVICALPSYLFLRLVKGLPEKYTKTLTGLKGLGSVNLIVSLKEQFLKDGTYWLNIGETKFPFLAVVEHTNFMDKANYGGENIIYLGNYLPKGHSYYEKDAAEILKEYLPYLKKINPNFDEAWINKIFLFKTPFAQPVVPLNYSKILPPITTPIEKLYLTNIEQVYPWDRGTNYAVALGEKVSDLVIKSA